MAQDQDRRAAAMVPLLAQASGGHRIGTCRTHCVSKGTGAAAGTRQEKCRALGGRTASSSLPCTPRVPSALCPPLRGLRVKTHWPFCCGSCILLQRPCSACGYLAPHGPIKWQCREYLGLLGARRVEVQGPCPTSWARVAAALTLCFCVLLVL